MIKVLINTSFPCITFLKLFSTTHFSSVKDFLYFVQGLSFFICDFLFFPSSIEAFCVMKIIEYMQIQNSLLNMSFLPPTQHFLKIILSLRSKF